MANANIAQLQLNNTFNEWRVITNVLANSANDLRNGAYVKDNGDLIIASGNVTITKPTGTTLLVSSDASVANQLTVKTFVSTDDITVDGANAFFTNASSYVQVSNTIFTKNLFSNTLIIGQNTITTDLTVGSDYSNGECIINGDASPSRTPIYQDGSFIATRRGLNFRGTGIASVSVSANIANTKITDIIIDAPSTAGAPGIKGEPGVTGEKGEPGAQGEQGFQGVQGAQGFQGIQGAQGVQGSKGESAEGGVGIKGDKGEQGEGDKGFQGTKGQKGELGGQGDIGDKGDKGDKGNQGISGISNDKGEKGDQGPQGIKGDKGDGGNLNAQLVKAYANFSSPPYPANDPGSATDGLPLLGAVTINGSNNISSITMAVDLSWDGGFWNFTPLVQYTLNFITPMANPFYAVAGSARKPSETETLNVWGDTPGNYYYSGSGHLQLTERNTNYVKVAFALAGENINDVNYYCPADADVIIIQQ
jgi:hypothetical protein